MANSKVNVNEKVWYALALARISVGFMLLWAFFDKLFGLGFSTCRDAKSGAVATMCDKAWINGGSPTEGFLKFAAKGPNRDLLNSLAGNHFIDILFMAGLLLIGIALIFGIAMRLATFSGIALFAMMWSAVLPPANNPVLDEHIIYIFVLIAVYYSNSHQRLGLGTWWSRQPLVKRLRILA